MSNKPIVVVVPGQELCRDILSEKARSKLASFATPIWNEQEKPLSREQLAELLPGAWGVLSSWGVPRFDEELAALANELKIIGHAAGSVKGNFYPAAFDAGIKVVNAAGTIADAVAQFTLATMLGLLLDYQHYNAIMHQSGQWPSRHDIHDLYGAKVGLISASQVGRRVIKLLQPFAPQIKVYDPYLPADAAQELGVEQIELDELMATCDVISVHAPVTDETIGMITADHIRAIRDGAVFINTARAAVIDYDALEAELGTGRFRAALDVFPQEPLAADSPFRQMPNVILTPHMAGWTEEARLRLIETVVDDMLRLWNGEPLQNEVLASKMSILA